MTRKIKVTITSLNKEQYFDVNEYVFDFERDLYPSNKDQILLGFEKGQEKTLELSAQGHTYLEVSAIELFDC